MKLLFSHVSPYLPGVEAIINTDQGKKKVILNGIQHDGRDVVYTDLRPHRPIDLELVTLLLKPLESIPVKLMEQYGYADIQELKTNVHIEQDVEVWVWDELVKERYDVFNLIENKRAEAVK